MSEGLTTKVLITVMTYPHPSRGYQELVPETHAEFSILDLTAQRRQGRMGPLSATGRTARRRPEPPVDGLNGYPSNAKRASSNGRCGRSALRVCRACGMLDHPMVLPTRG